MWNLSKLKDLKNVDKDDLLDVLGLETKKSATDWLLPAAGIFGVGFLVGASVALMLAPKSGAELREDLRHRLGRDGHEAGAFPPAAGSTERAPKPA